MSKSPKCQNLQNVKISKMSKSPKCQIVNQIVTISNVMYYQSVWIRLAHRLYSDFQYFFFIRTFWVNWWVSCLIWSEWVLRCEKRQISCAFSSQLGCSFRWNAEKVKSRLQMYSFHHLHFNANVLPELPQCVHSGFL